MTLNPILTEQTTAFTDLLLAVLSVIVIAILRRKGLKVDRTKTRLWTWAFALLMTAALLGAIAHGFAMTERLNFILWQPLNLALGLTVSMFVVGVVYDLRGFSVRRSFVVAMIATGIAFYAVTILFPGAFLVFIIYEALAMLFALVIYARMAMSRSLQGSALMAAGILVTMVAAAIQASGAIFVKIIWSFDFNGIFHLVQMPGVLLLLAGLSKELSTRDRAK